MNCKGLTALLLFANGWLVSASADSPRSLYYAISEPSSNSWTSYSVPLVETAGWTIGSPAGPAPTQSEFTNILSYLNGFTVGFATTSFLSLDNVSLAGLVTSIFPNCTSDGWMVGDNDTAGCNSLIGNPPGSINNGAAPAVFDAPSKYLGNQSSGYNGTLAFDMEEEFLIGQSGYVILTASPDPKTLGPSSVLPWGDNYSGQSSISSGLTNVAAIAAGRYHSLALRTDGTVAAWGWSTYNGPDFVLGFGQLTSGQTNMPAGLTNVVAIASGGYHNLALKADGTVIAWGNDTYGQTNVPPDLTNAVAVAAGGYHSLALKTDGTVIAWGVTNTVISDGHTNNVSPNFGQSFVPSTLSNVVAIAGGDYHSLALKSGGTVVAWGRNNSGQTNVPLGLTNVSAIAAGSSHSLALKADGTVLAWGNNTSGQTNVPPGLTNIVAIAAGDFFNLALGANGTVVAWGDNKFLQANVPVGLSNVVSIAGGGYHSLALMGSGPPMLRLPVSSVTRTPNGFSVALPTRSGRVYVLEYKNSLTDSNWTALPLTAGNGGILTVSDPTVAGPQRFYRVQQW